MIEEIDLERGIDLKLRKLEAEVKNRAKELSEPYTAYHRACRELDDYLYSAERRYKRDILGYEHRRKAMLPQQKENQ